MAMSLAIVRSRTENGVDTSPTPSYSVDVPWSACHTGPVSDALILPRLIKLQHKQDEPFPAAHQEKQPKKIVKIQEGIFGKCDSVINVTPSFQKSFHFRATTTFHYLFSTFDSFCHKNIICIRVLQVPAAAVFRYFKKWIIFHLKESRPILICNFHDMKGLIAAMPELTGNSQI